MKLGTKINLVLIVVTVVTLTVGFWIIIGREATTIKKQVLADVDAVTQLVHQDIEGIIQRYCMLKSLTLMAMLLLPREAQIFRRIRSVSLKYLKKFLKQRSLSLIKKMRANTMSLNIIYQYLTARKILSVSQK